METVKCEVCEAMFPPDDVITIEGINVCAECKPIFVQKLREGMSPAGEMVYAGFWIRVGAKFIDGIILAIAGWGLGFVVSFIGGRGVGLFGNMLSWGAWVAYGTYFVGRYAATPGKMACGLKIVRSEGEAVGYGRACGRLFAEFLSSLILGIGYLMVAFDREKRGLHDRICDTRVIKA